jgi:hypothetical protein
MNARRDSSDGPEAGSFGGRALLVGAVVFGAAATGLLVLTDQEKWLRLGIVAALWAALIGAFLAARYRRQLADQREGAAERQEIYELELEREIAARREHELTVEAEAKRKAEEERRDDIAALKAELQNMRETLESLLGGEFLVERYALRAESTRMRSLPEDRALAVRRDVKHLPAASAKNVAAPPVVREAETELIERVREVHQKSQRRPEQRAADSRPPSVPRGPERPRPERPTPEPVQPTAQPAQRREHPAEVSDRWFVPDGLADAGPQPARRSEQPRRKEQPRPADLPPPRRPNPNWEDTGEQEWAPSWEKRQEPRFPESAAGHHDMGAPIGGRAEQTSWLAQYNKPAKQQPEPSYGSRAYVGQPSLGDIRPVEQSQRNLPPATPSIGNMPPADPRKAATPSLRNVPPADPTQHPPSTPSVRDMPPVEPGQRQSATPSFGSMPPATPSLRNMPPVDPGQRQPASGFGGMPSMTPNPRNIPAVDRPPATPSFGSIAPATPGLRNGSQAEPGQATSSFGNMPPVTPSLRNMPPVDPGQRPPATPSFGSMPPVTPSLRNMPPVDPGQRHSTPSFGNMPPVAMPPVAPGMQPVNQSLRNISPVDPSLRNVPAEPPASHRHRAAEDDSGGGRRRRAEGQPSWQETVGRRAEEPTGSHASGRSVSELLANHGLDSSPRRRRRRED